MTSSSDDSEIYSTDTFGSTELSLDRAIPSSSQQASALDHTGSSFALDGFLGDFESSSTVDQPEWSSSNQQVSHFDQIASSTHLDEEMLFSDVELSPANTPESIDWYIDTTSISTTSSENDGVIFSPYSSDDVVFDDSFEIADCSATENLLPAMGIGKGKSRVRRLDDSRSCKDPNTTSPPTAGDTTGSGEERSKEEEILMNLLNDPAFLELLAGAQKNTDHNFYCYLYTNGLLPWGVCSSGNPADQTLSPVPLDIAWWGSFGIWRLNRCTLGTFFVFCF